MESIQQPSERDNSKSIEHEGVSPPSILGERVIRVGQIITVEQSQHFQMRARSVLLELHALNGRILYRDYIKGMLGMGYSRDEANRTLDALPCTLHSDLTITFDEPL